ncbi:MAG TPA: alpha-ketoglutarate-dependent dioxygenase AlkB [Acidimicrobiia bacterium]|nr:alpha-ketoglutarate-dependent dioxygenase AlkB [Acidimicrobiia bacterium]
MTNTRSTLPTFGAWQPSLLDADIDAPSFDASFSSARLIALDDVSWVELVAGWVRGADALFTELVEVAPWAQRRRHMYDRIVDEPRLTAWYGDGLVDESLPGAVREMAAALSARYERTFDGVGAALYRDGHDSVAWHGDKIALEIVDPVVALVSLGSPRTLRLRNKVRHRESHAFTLLPGDLLVMGGSTQRTWEHSIPKVAKAGPRLSLQFRHSE